jgi:outer membrane receptor protein involved in Fe transport
VVCVLPLARAAEAAAVETVVVTASALPGTTVDPDQIPASVQTISSADLTRLGAASTLRTLNDQASGVSLSDAQDNPFQPNLFYRGFEASPLAGDAQGLAVYLDGVRLNQPFGDVVNWDLIPDIAIARLTVEGSNPVFGLNALGGSVSVTMKNGFGWQGGQAEVEGGSFGRAQGSLQFGEDDGATSVYAAATALNDDGWRAHSPSHLVQSFADFGWRGDGAELHLDIAAAASGLTGNGTAPVQLLAIDRAAVFTFPDKTDDHYGLANLFGSAALAPELSLQGNAYLSHFRQGTSNGDASDASPCAGGLLCLDDGTIVTNTQRKPIPDFLNGGTYGQLNLTDTDTLGFGGSLQASDKAALFGFDNQLLAGVAYDGGRTDFAAHSELGVISLARGFLGPGVTIDVVNGEIAPVKVASDNDYYGAYAADILSLTPSLSLSVSARLNEAQITLHDRLGTALSGAHGFTHLNPAAGLTYKLTGATTLYAGYAEANRAPTPAEFSCASAAAPCSLTNFFVGDPSLKQVVAHTLEAGARGMVQEGDATFHWDAGAYRIETDNDIMFVASAIVGRDFFRNIGTTERQGLELSGDLSDGAWLASLRYAYTDATFQSPLTLDSPDNPRADPNGEIHVRPGDVLPSIPKNTLKLVVTYQPSGSWNVSVAARYADGQYLRGDESNLNPRIPSYVVVDASASYRLNARLELFAEIENLLDARYATFGTFSPTSAVPIVQLPDASDPRALSPGAPRAAYAGVRVTL